MPDEVPNRTRCVACACRAFEFGTTFAKAFIFGAAWAKLPDATEREEVLLGALCKAHKAVMMAGLSDYAKLAGLVDRSLS